MLVADDEELLRTLIARILDQEGFRAVVARTGDEAASRLREAPLDFDAVVLDLTMPPGGLETLRALLAQREDLGVVVTSGLSLGPELRVALAGCRGEFLHKPFAPDQLLRALAKVMPEE